MTGQYLGGRPITLSYAFKKDGQKGERHGSAAERRLADLGKKNNVLVTGFLPPSFVLPVPLPQGFSEAAGPGAGVPSGAPGGWSTTWFTGSDQPICRSSFCCTIRVFQGDTS